MRIDVGNITFESQEQLDFAQAQYEEFGRCPHVYLIADGTMRYVGSRFGKNAPLHEYWGSPTDDYVWDESKRRHILRVFRGDVDPEEVTNFEQQMIDLYDAVNDPNFLNKTRQTNGQGARTEASRDARLKLWPETNGTVPQWYETSRRVRLEKYPDTNGASPKWMEAGHEANKRRWSETNGAPPQFIKAGQQAAARARSVSVEVKLKDSNKWVNFRTASAAVKFAGYKSSNAAAGIIKRLRSSPNGELTLTTGPRRFWGISFRFPPEDDSTP